MKKMKRLTMLLDEEDNANMILDDLELSNYDDIEKQINLPEMTQLQDQKNMLIKS